MTPWHSLHNTPPIKPRLVQLSQVHETLMAPADNSRIALLNEVSKRAGPHKGGAAGAAATTGAVAASNALQRSQQTLAAAATAAAGRLGRPLFCKTPALAAQAGMLGLLVKLNLGALPLQPGVEQGPMMSYEPRSLAMVLAAKKEGLEIGPAPRDDVGMVVRDLGPGTWRGLLVSDPSHLVHIMALPCHRSACADVPYAKE